MSLSNPNSLVTEQRLKEFYDGIHPYFDPSSYKMVFKQTLEAGQSTVTFTNIPVGSDYLLEFYTSNGMNYKKLTQSGEVVTLTFEIQSSDVTVYCEVKTTLSTVHYPTLKSVYRDIVLDRSTGLIYGNVIPFSERSEVNEGGYAIDTVTRTVWVYADMTILKNQSGDWYAQATLESLASSYFPKQKTSAVTDVSICTDPSSSTPKTAFFITTGARLSMADIYSIKAGERYIVYGSWQY